MKIEIEIKNCSECPHFKSTPYPTDDSWEKPEYWWCKADNAVAPNLEAEKRRKNIMINDKLLGLRLIAEYVEWNDKTPIPEWCSCKLEK